MTHTPAPARQTSRDLYARAVAATPGGVHSPVRAFGSVGGDPLFIARGAGAHVWDADGNRLLDLQMSWGPLILGHADAEVVAEVQRAAAEGLSFGATHRREVELAELVVSAFPGMDQCRFVSSGTEAVMTALRLARGANGRGMIVKFAGGYHGHSDGLLVRAGSGLVTGAAAGSEPTSAGIAPEVAHTTLVAPFDDDGALDALFDAHGADIAAVIVEPMPANNGLLLQRKAWLQGLRARCDAHGALLVFDEVISGFRLHFGGYGALVSVRPDLVTLGKIVGGGMPVGAVVGSRALLEQLAPLGPVYQAGTLSGNPVSMAAGIATLRRLRDGEVHTALEALGARLEAGLLGLGRAEVQVVRRGSIVWPWLDSAPPPHTADGITDAHVARFGAIHRPLLDAGYYLPPSAYEVLFLSAAHTAADIDGFVAALDVALAAAEARA